MNKYCILVVTFVLSGCSVWSGWNFSWNDLNPWADEYVETVEKTDEFGGALPANVNKYLWNASIEKLSFMGIESKNEQDGIIVTTWKSPKSAANERFKIAVKVEGGDLRADALDIKIYKQVRSKKGWIDAKPSDVFGFKVEQEIINQAKILYIKDKSKGMQ